MKEDFRATGHIPNRAVTFSTLDMPFERKCQCTIKNVQRHMHLCTELAFASTCKKHLSRRWQMGNCQFRETWRPAAHFTFPYLQKTGPGPSMNAP